ncbi:hypothetical protein COU13_00135 [Candidatus Kaiserbacteria bacterium CG10_big_fil_rev_8_21_14_0_10_43_70]|uniref:Uncharacterized protein n=1 Tax=Candidatus Kaiserbacteria bacterium CG10_big_fil_rev_8_21_14_0_10_43_70 TaxID=1974605 RepID=A0A2H0ULC4_9BACT|nr:MAG: hypothetical protein COU13_00135 [Candidatus Kaiserbacteria bacterium CG10_big_fil_rev_8_21_14_0_10_43_70]
MKSGKTILFVILAILVLVIGVFLFTAEIGNYEPIGNANEVSVEAEFQNKIVYTTDSLADTGPLIEHCEMRGGVFNACGSICESPEEICASVCAFTCELSN